MFIELIMNEDTDELVLSCHIFIANEKSDLIVNWVGIETFVSEL